MENQTATQTEPIAEGVTSAENTTAPQENGTTQPQDSGTEPERTFTQSQVNEIIQKRLARQKSDADELAQLRTEKQNTEKATDGRNECERLVNLSNTMLSTDACPEKKGLPRLDKELLDILPTDDPATFRKYAIAIQNYADKKVSPFRDVDKPKQVTEDTVLRNLFGLKKKG